MTARELNIIFNNKFGIDKWPKFYDVDHHTYAECCQTIFSIKETLPVADNIDIIIVSIGPNKGLYFKNVELILKG